MMALSLKIFAILFTTAILYACNESDQASRVETNPDSLGSDKPAAMDTPHVVIKTAIAGAEQDFLNYAVPKNANEIVWLKAGLAKGSLKDIREHSAMMLKDHSKLSAEIKKYMSGKPGLTIPVLDKADTVNIEDKTGEGWDKGWTGKMIDDHQELLDKLKKAQADIEDADLIKIITNTIPVIASHLSMAKKIRDKLNK